MRRAILLALMMIPLCACGAADRAQMKFEDFRDSLQTAQAVSFTMDTTTDLGEEIFSCVLRCRRCEEGCRVTVEEPEELRGVCADVSRGTVEYDGLELYIGELPDGLSPMGSAEIFADAMLSAFVQEVYGEGPLTVRTYLDERTDVIIQYDFDAVQPVSGEIIRDGRMVISCGIRDFSAE